MWEDNPTGGANVTTEPAKPAESPEKGERKADTVSRKEFDALMKQLEETRESERYWAAHSKQKAEPEEEAPRKGKKAAEPEPDEDDMTALLAEDPAAFITEFGESGLKALAKRGFITERRAKRMIADVVKEMNMEKIEALMDGKIKKAQKGMVDDAQLIKSYPDLSDEKSDMFKLTSKYYKDMVAEDKSVPQAFALKHAAKMADLELRSSGRSDREERISRQGASGDRRRGGYEMEDADEELTPVQKNILAKLNADGGIQISEEAYKKRAKSGTNMSAKMAYQPGDVKW